MAKPKKKFKIPGGNIIIPMFIGAFINSLFPDLLQIGGFTTPLATGSGALVGAFLFVIGGTISFKTTPAAAKRGGTIILTKIFVSIVIGLGVAKLFNNNLLGLSALSIIGAMSGANNAMYSGIVHEFGDEVDEAAVGITILSVGPMVTMIALASSGLAAVSVTTLIATILPLIVGMVLANLFPAIKTMLTQGMNASIIVVGFALGCSMDFQQIFVGGLPGILLGVIVTLVGGVITIFTDRLTGGSGVAGAAISSTAGAAMATPAALAAVDASYKSVAGVATAQITAAVVVTAILTPILTSWIARKNKTNDPIKVDDSSEKSVNKRATNNLEVE